MTANHILKQPAALEILCSMFLTEPAIVAVTISISSDPGEYIVSLSMKLFEDKLYGYIEREDTVVALLKMCSRLKVEKPLLDVSSVFGIGILIMLKFIRNRGNAGPMVDWIRSDW